MAEVEKIDINETTHDAVVDQPTEEQSAAEPQPAEQQKSLDDEFYVGEWNGLRNYGCPECEFTTIDGSLAVVEHIQDGRHHGVRREKA